MLIIFLVHGTTWNNKKKDSVKLSNLSAIGCITCISVCGQPKIKCLRFESRPGPLCVIFPNDIRYASAIFFYCWCLVSSDCLMPKKIVPTWRQISKKIVSASHIYTNMLKIIHTYDTHTHAYIDAHNLFAYQPYGKRQFHWIVSYLCLQLANTALGSVFQPPPSNFHSKHPHLALTIYRHQPSSIWRDDSKKKC